MKEQRKLWVGLSLALSGSVAAQTAHADSGAELAAGHSGVAFMAASLAGEGEGEGEGSNSKPADLAQDDQAYLTRLGLIRGHLLSGHELYEAGHADMAVTHMKHPRDELYSGLVPAIKTRGGSPFDAELSTLAELVEQGADKQAVREAYDELDAAIRAVQEQVDADLRTELLSLMSLVRTAGEEYAIGVKDGQLANAHEYQDAYGFTQIAKRRLQQLDEEFGADHAAVLEKVRKQLNGLDSLWPNIKPPQTLDTDASQLYGAAARIELAALGV